MAHSPHYKNEVYPRLKERFEEAMVNEEKKEKLVKFLENGAFPQFFYNPKRNTCLPIAEKLGEPRILQLLFNRGLLHAVLYKSEYGGDEKIIIDCLLKRRAASGAKSLRPGADPNYYRHGNTSFQIAVQCCSIRVIRLMIACGAKLEEPFKSMDGRTPLMFAIDAFRVDVVKELLVQGVDINKTDRYGHTPLAYALFGIVNNFSYINPLYKRKPHTTEILKILLEQGVNTKVSCSNLFPLQYIRKYIKQFQNTNEELEKYLRQAEELLLQYTK